MMVFPSKSDDLATAATAVCHFHGLIFVDVHAFSRIFRYYISLS